MSSRSAEKIKIASFDDLFGEPVEEQLVYVSNGVQYQLDAQLGIWGVTGAATVEDQLDLQYQGLFGEMTDSQKNNIDVNIDDSVPGNITIKMTMNASLLESIASSASGDIETSLEGTSWGTAEVEYKIIDGALNSVSVYVPFSMNVDGGQIDISVSMQMVVCDEVIDFPAEIGA